MSLVPSPSPSPSPEEASYLSHESLSKKPKIEIEDDEDDGGWTPPAWKDPNAELDDWKSDDLEIRYRFIEDEETRKEAIRYHRELDEKGPFNIDFFPTRFGVGASSILPVLARRYPGFDGVESAARFAIKQHNKQEGTEFKFDCLKRANDACGFTYYITFDVVDKGS